MVRDRQIAYTYEYSNTRVRVRVRVTKEEIVKKAGEDGITIECISPNFVRISIKSNFVTFVVAYAPIEGSRKRQRSKRRKRSKTKQT